MTYSILKTLHIFSVVLWLSGLIMLALFMSTKARELISQPGLSRLLHRWEKTVTNPALGGVWIFGIWMAQYASWWTSKWLMLKLVFVVALSALHGILAGRIKRMAHEPNSMPKSPLPFAVPATIISILVIVTLVELKPF